MNRLRINNLGEAPWTQRHELLGGAFGMTSLSGAGEACGMAVAASGESNKARRKPTGRGGNSALFGGRVLSTDASARRAIYSHASRRRRRNSVFMPVGAQATVKETYA